MEECLDQTLANLGTDYLDRKYLKTCVAPHSAPVTMVNTSEVITRVYFFLVYLIHWPVPLNPKGNHPIFPLLPDGKRDVDHSWDIRDTWKQMEAVLKKGVNVTYDSTSVFSSVSVMVNLSLRQG